MDFRAISYEGNQTGFGMRRLRRAAVVADGNWTWPLRQEPIVLRAI
ncbi:hypothetical protein RLEG3_06520 (plasmid) [Rhizobium leguminosarum bv. trifolii WSM1689]|nr:hypothetical protein RLEG3_06520 [Rhizobium leguminosarum bv. trifolii WSM1689]